MTDYKQIIAANIQKLRKDFNITQAELAEELNYTDKAISKWERGESIPDAIMLKQLADRFGVTVDYFFREEHDAATEKEVIGHSRQKKSNRGFITGMSVTVVWLIAVICCLIAKEHGWLTLIFAVPASFIVWLVLNSLWFSRRRNFLIISFLMWTFIAAVFIAFIVFNINLWMIFLLGIPGQLIILLWSGINTRKKK